MIPYRTPFLYFRPGRTGELVARLPDGKIVLPARGEKVEEGKPYKATKLVPSRSGRALIAYGLVCAWALPEHWKLLDEGALFEDQPFPWFVPGTEPEEAPPEVHRHVQQVYERMMVCKLCGGRKDSPSAEYCRACRDRMEGRRPVPADPRSYSYPDRQVPVPDPPSHSYPSREEIAQGAPIVCSCGARLDVGVAEVETDRGELMRGIRYVKCPREDEDWKRWAESLPDPWYMAYREMLGYYYAEPEAARIVWRFASRGKTPRDWFNWWLSKMEE